MRRLACLSAALLWAGFLPAPSNAATLNVSGGQLLGASNVDVGGTLYDVEFVDGTCIELFNGCDESSDFTFQTASTAEAASQALLDQVFIDGGLGNFDTQPELTTGCSNLSSCLAITPYGPPAPTLGPVGRAANTSASSPFPDFTDLVDFALLDDLTLSPPRTYASWALVPEPTTALLMTAGLFLLSARRRSVGR